MNGSLESLVRRHAVDLLLAVLAITGVVAVISTRSRVTTGEASARSGNVISVWRADDLGRLQIERSREHIVLERERGTDAGTTQWSITAPIHEAADAYAVDKLLGALEHASWVRRIAAGSIDAKTTGVDAPRVVMKLQMGSIAVTLSLGSPAASPAGSAYLEVTSEGAPGSGILIVPKDVVDALETDLEALRTRDLVAYDRAELARIAVTAQNRRVEITKTDWGDWVIGTGVRADRDAVERIMVGLERASLDRVLGLAEATSNLSARDRVTLEVAPRDAARGAVKLEMGGSCPGDAALVVAIRRAPDPIAGCVPMSVLTAVESAARDVQSVSLFWLHPDEVEELEIELDSRKLTLERKGSGFLLRAPQKGDVELAAGNARLSAVTSLTGTPIDSAPAELGLDPPLGRVTLRSAGATDAEVRTETVDLGRRQSDGSIAARRKRDGVVLRLAASALGPLTPDATLLRSSKILELSAGDVSELDLISPRVSQRIVRRDSGVLELVEPHGFGFDSTLIDDVVRVLGSLTAVRWVSDRDDGGFGLSHPRIEVHVRLNADGGERERIVRVGDPTSGGSFASIDDTGGVFVLSSGTVDTLDTLVLDRGLFALTPEVTKHVEIVAAGRTVELVRSGDRFVEPHGGTLSPGQIQTITDMLSGLRAEAAVHVGPPRPEEGLLRPLLVVRYSLKEGPEREWSLGSGDSWRSMSIHYARVKGVDATYVLARAPVQAILGTL